MKRSRAFRVLGPVVAVLFGLATLLTPQVVAGIVWVVVTASMFLISAVLVVDWCARRRSARPITPQLATHMWGHLIFVPVLLAAGGASYYWGHHAAVLPAIALAGLPPWFDAYRRVDNRLRVEADEPAFHVRFARGLAANTVVDSDDTTAFPRTLADQVLRALSHFGAELSPLQAATSSLLAVLFVVSALSGGLDDLEWAAISAGPRAGLGGGASIKPQTPAGNRSTPTSPRSSRSKQAGMPSRVTPPTRVGGVQRDDGHQYDDDCRAIPRPGEDAPVWARAALYRLYLGPALPGQYPPGATAGCAGPTVVPRIFDATLVYDVGVDAQSGQTLSIAVDSRAFGPAIFLAPAVGIVRSLLRRGVEVGGYPRVDVGRGDLYCLKTPTGSELIVRAEKGEPYVVLPPAATAAFVEAVERFGWLWPERDASHPSSFSLSASAIAHDISVTITLQPRSGAWLYGGRLRGVAPSRVDLSAVTLERFHREAGGE